MCCKDLLPYAWATARYKAIHADFSFTKSIYRANQAEGIGQ